MGLTGTGTAREARAMERMRRADESLRPSMVKRWGFLREGDRTGWMIVFILVDVNITASARQIRQCSRATLSDHQRPSPPFSISRLALETVQASIQCTVPATMAPDPSLILRHVCWFPFFGSFFSSFSHIRCLTRGF